MSKFAPLPAGSTVDGRAGGISNPGLGVPQHLVALARANRIRGARAHFKREVAAAPGLGGARLIAAALANPPVGLRSMPVVELLGAQRRWGSSRTLRLLARHGVLESRQIGQLTPRQVAVLSRALVEPYTERASVSATRAPSQLQLDRVPS